MALEKKTSTPALLGLVTVEKTVNFKDGKVTHGVTVTPRGVMGRILWTLMFTPFALLFTFLTALLCIPFRIYRFIRGQKD